MRSSVGLLPADVAVAELYDAVDGVELFPQEAEAIAGAVEKRRREFGWSGCARGGRWRGSVWRPGRSRPVPGPEWAGHRAGPRASSAA
ncbi:hypothetical protein AB0478_22970 [Streptomyces sp. NPDC051917]|uniref:hypothetical protein n=1 Tax=Streptomyces sp. NPDC051917 TaxID=3154754 RepID=UPI00344BCC98